MFATKFSNTDPFFLMFGLVHSVSQYRAFTQTDLCGLRSQSLNKKKVSVPLIYIIFKLFYFRTNVFNFRIFSDMFCFFGYVLLLYVLFCVFILLLFRYMSWPKCHLSCSLHNFNIYSAGLDWSRKLVYCQCQCFVGSLLTLLLNC